MARSPTRLRSAHCVHRATAGRTSGVVSLVPNPVPPDVRIKSIPSLTHCLTVCARSGLSSATILFSVTEYTPCCWFKTSRRVGRERSEVGSCAAVSDTHSRPTLTIGQKSQRRGLYGELEQTHKACWHGLREKTPASLPPTRQPVNFRPLANRRRVASKSFLSLSDCNRQGL